MCITKVCQCGCNEAFYPALRYKNGVKEYPIYQRGHHPNCRKNQTGKTPPWNKGLKKGDHPSIDRMGYQPGHPAYCNWDHVIEMQRNDLEYRRRWLKSKKGQVAWNKGLKKTDYLNGIASGPDHGNWKGGKRGIYDSVDLRDFCKSIMKRDNYTCQKCGDRNHKGRGSRIRLEVHHIVAIKEDHTLVFNPDNAITLCKSCHIKTDNYGTKLVHKLRKQSGK